MSGSGTIASGSRGLLALLVRDEAGPALGGLQPSCLALLLAGEASEIVRLPVPAGVSDELFHPLMMRAGVRQAIVMSRDESFLSRAVWLNQWRIADAMRGRRRRR